MQIRRYRPSDCRGLARLFYDTVHSVTATDYTEAQRNAWAPKAMDLEEWQRSLCAHHTLVAVEGDAPVGFGDIDETGYLDRLYVHKDHQRKGIATALCDELERAVRCGKITAAVSVTAKPFFEGRGYVAVKKQQVERRGVLLLNYRMEKSVFPGKTP